MADDATADAAGMLATSTLTLAAIGDASSAADNIELLANVALRCRAFPDAAELFGAAESIRRTIDAPVRASLQAENDEGIATVKRMMDETSFAAAYQRGQALDFAASTERVSVIARHIVAHARSRAPVLPPSTTIEVLNDPHHLTGREREVLRLLSDGRSTSEIAAMLFISPRTASTHVTNILCKLDVTSRAAAVAYAMRVGLV